jgi:hypothetical protein
MIVTNIVGTFEKKSNENKPRVQEGYFMDNYLVQNLLGVPKYLRKAKDVVCIVSGHGKVRIGKSTMASQVGTFLAWLIAGGEIELEQVMEDGKERTRVKQRTWYSLQRI